MMSAVPRHVTKLLVYQQNFSLRLQGPQQLANPLENQGQSLGVYITEIPRSFYAAGKQPAAIIVQVWDNLMVFFINARLD